MASEESRTDHGWVAPGTQKPPANPPLFDPAAVRPSRGNRSSKTPDSDRDLTEKPLADKEPAWARLPATLAAATVAVPVDLIAHFLSGVSGTIADSIATLLVAPGVWKEIRDWRKGRKDKK